jgi:hypothetical protein
MEDPLFEIHSPKEHIMTLILVLVAVFAINIIFGYWRSNTKRFAVQWFMAVHIPVPLSIGLRLLLLGWSWIVLPVFVAVFFAGQYVGGMTRRLLTKSRPKRLSSFLVLDIIRVIWQ